MATSIRRRIACLAWAVAALVAGLVWRLAPLHLPFVLYKYGGSAIWAVMVYWLVAALLPGARPSRSALIACIAAAAIEAIRLYHAPALDAFRLTLAGRLLLGRVFSFADIAVYWIAIGTVASMDKNPG